MNYLAHLFLAGDCPSSMVGQMVADFVRPREISRYPSVIQAGIRFHQLVDGYSDRHPAFAASRRRFAPPFRRYSGILVDLAYDHFLAKNWAEYSPALGLTEFSQRAYTVLLEHEPILPARLRRILPRMVEDDWLVSYGDLDNIHWALEGISRRLRHENPLGDSIEVLRQQLAHLERDFREFFPDLTAFAERMGPGGTVPRGTPNMSEPTAPLARATACSSAPTLGPLSRV